MSSDSGFLSMEGIKKLQVHCVPFEIPGINEHINLIAWNGKTRAIVLSEVMRVYDTDDLKEVKDIRSLSPEKLSDFYDVMNRAIVMSMCDDKGNLLYDINNEEHMKEISKIKGDISEIIFNKISEMNGLREVEIKKEIKNSESTQN
jgi:hypothetical protein